jgi:glycosyltransferase involved in cell wall biosynthesis
VVPNGIDPEDYAVDRGAAREDVWRALPELNGARYVLFLGRLHRKKRLDLLVEAFLASAPESVKLVVAGPDEGRVWQTLAKRINASGRACRVVRVGGVVNGRDKIQLLAGASLFALPSEHENFGIAALEALAAGTQVLLSPHVDLAEATLAVGLGCTAPLDVQVWGERIAQILTKEDERGILVERARGWVRDNYSWQRIAGLLVQHYRRVTGGTCGELSGMRIPQAS